MAKTVKDIEVITGETNPNILLIAPHGAKGDDDNTGKLASNIQKKLGCNAIINKIFKKPKIDEKTGKYEETDIDKRVANLNVKPDAEKHPSFIKILKEKITDPGSTYVFWIHGIDDDNLNKEAEKLNKTGLKCLVGYGQPIKNNLTMSKKQAQSLAALITDKGLLAEPTDDKSEKYRGADPGNMNQYFKKVGGDMSAVQSVQLEFAKEGVREEKNIAKSACKIALAISALTGCKTIDIAEMEPEEALVAEATEKVIEFIKSNHDNSITVGRYLIEKFYDNNFDFARKGKKTKGKSLNKMLDDLKEKPDAPSKSWFYNTINLAVDDEEFKEVIEYGKLNLSHKINLTLLNKNEKQREVKLELIKKIAKDGMLVKDLVEKINEIKAKDKPKQEWPSVEELIKMKEEEISKQREKAENRKKAIKNALDKLNKKLAEQQAELQKCDQFLSAVNDTNLPAAA